MFMKKFSGTLCAGFLTLALGGCEQEGPAERAGEQVDEATEQAGEAMEKAGERMQEETTNP